MSTGEDATGSGAATTEAGASAFSAEQLAIIDQIVAARVAASTDLLRPTSFLSRTPSCLGRGGKERRKTRPGDGASRRSQVYQIIRYHSELYLPVVVGDDEGVSDALVAGGGRSKRPPGRQRSGRSLPTAQPRRRTLPPPWWQPQSPSRLLLSTLGNQRTDPKRKRNKASSRAVRAPVGCEHCLADCTVSTTCSWSVMRMRQPPTSPVNVRRG